MSKNQVTVALSDYNTHIRVSKVDLNNKLDHIPAFVYNVAMDTENGDLILIKDRKNFDVKKDIYGRAKQYEERLIEDFKKTKTSLGAILSGVKGSGKSLMTERVGNYFIQVGMPVLYINNKLPTTLLQAAIKIASPCVVIFDEFEKNYSTGNYVEGETGDQDRFLNFFSDTSYKQVLFMITVNSINKLSEFFIDRPGRFKYHFRFTGLAKSVFDELVEEHKVSGWKKEVLRQFVLQNSRYSYDSIIQIIKILKESKNIIHFNEEISILNVGGHVTLMLNIKEFEQDSLITINDSIVTGVMRFIHNKKNSNFSAIFHDINNSMVFKEDINYEEILSNFFLNGVVESSIDVGGNSVGYNLIIFINDHQNYDQTSEQDVQKMNIDQVIQVFKHDEDIFNIGESMHVFVNGYKNDFQGLTKERKDQSIEVEGMHNYDHKGSDGVNIIPQRDKFIFNNSNSRFNLPF